MQKPNKNHQQQDDNPEGFHYVNSKPHQKYRTREQKIQYIVDCLFPHFYRSLHQTHQNYRANTIEGICKVTDSHIYKHFDNKFSEQEIKHNIILKADKNSWKAAINDKLGYRLKWNLQWLQQNQIKQIFNSCVKGNRTFYLKLKFPNQIRYRAWGPENYKKYREYSTNYVIIVFKLFQRHNQNEHHEYKNYFYVQTAYIDHTAHFYMHFQGNYNYKVYIKNQIPKNIETNYYFDEWEKFL